MSTRKTNKLKLARNALGICLSILTVVAITNFLFEITGNPLIPVKSYQTLPILCVLLIIFIATNKLISEQNAE